MPDMNVDDGAGRQRTVKVDYPSNSKKAKEPERPRPEKVVEGVVSRRKRGSFSQLRETFVSEDAGSVMGYILMEVLVPAAKNMIVDAANQALERTLFGDARPSRSAGRGGYTNYNTRPPVGTRPADPRPALSRQARASHDFDDVIFTSRAEAEDVLDRLRDLINQYEVATVSDLYDLAGFTDEFTDNKWGWFDLKSASVRAIRGGYLLSLPRTQPIT